MQVAVGLQHRADGADAAIHHVAGRDDVDAGLGLHARLAGQHGHGRVVDDVARLVEEAVLAVRRERIERDVGHHAELGELLLQRAHGAWNQAIRVERLGAVGRLQVRLDGREQGQRGHAQADALLGHTEQSVDGHALHAGHAGDVLHLVVTVDHEHRQDEVAGVQPVLAHQLAAEGIAPHAARAAGGKWGQVRHSRINLLRQKH